jgi:hypothetical protein
MAQEPKFAMNHWTSRKFGIDHALAELNQVESLQKERHSVIKMRPESSSASTPYSGGDISTGRGDRENGISNSADKLSIIRC